MAPNEELSHRLLAMIVSQTESELTARQVKAFVGTHLPKYMIPANQSARRGSSAWGDREFICLASLRGNGGGRDLYRCLDQYGSRIRN